MANSRASIFIKTTTAFSHGNTFVFGSWVCTIDGTRSFQCYITVTPDLEIGFVTLIEVATNQLVEKFDANLLYNIRDWIHLQLKLDGYMG
jgi:hypothetical protein